MENTLNFVEKFLPLRKSFYAPHTHNIPTVIMAVLFFLASNTVGYKFQPWSVLPTSRKAVCFVSNFFIKSNLEYCTYFLQTSHDNRLSWYRSLDILRQLEEGQ